MDEATRERALAMVCAAVASRAADAVEYTLDNGAPDAINQCESPIEFMFLAGLWAEAVERGLWARVYFHDAEQWSTLDAESKAYRLDITPQWRRGKLRHDFHVELRAFTGWDGEVPCWGKSACVLVECDGHEYHNKTKAQAQRDRSRDRRAASEGLTVLRFTGSEIYRDAVKCASECVAILLDRIHGSGNA